MTPPLRPLPSAPTSPTRSNAFVAAFLLCAAASIVPLWSVKYPPMLDLPQYAAQLSIIKHLHDPAFGYEGVFTVRWFSPYVLSMAVARFFYSFMDVLIALKITATLVVLLWPLSFLTLIKTTDGDKWLSLLAFPFAYGHCFYQGLLNFQLAVPMGIFTIALAIRAARTRDKRLAWALAGACCFLFFCHASVFLFSLVIMGVYFLAAGSSWKERIVLLAPLFAPLPILLFWLAIIPAHGIGEVTGVDMATFLYRLKTFPAILLDFTPGPGKTLAWGTTAFLVLLLIPTHGLRRHRPLTIAAGVVLIAYLFAPQYFFLDVFISQRLAPFLAALALAHVYLPAESRLARIARAALITSVMCWMVFLCARFQVFDQDIHRAEHVLAGIQPRKRTLALLFDRRAEDLSVLELHTAQWAQAYKGGVVKFSFASYGYPQLASFTDPNELAQHRAQEQLSHHPDTYVWNEQDNYDYFVLRSYTNKGDKFFPSGTPVRLLLQKGPWRLYERVK